MIYMSAMKEILLDYMEDKEKYDYESFTEKAQYTPEEEKAFEERVKQFNAGNNNQTIPEVKKPENGQEKITSFSGAFKQGADVLYQGAKSAAGETINLLGAGSKRDYERAIEQLDELVNSGYDLTSFDSKKALKDYKDRDYQKR